jgi:hemoglobin-like flavoprotein
MTIRRHPLTSSRATPGLRPDLELADRLERSAKACSAPAGGAAPLAALAERFYERLFARAPQVRPMFPADMTKQREKFAQMLEQVIANLRSADDLSGPLRELGARHVDYGAKPVHYQVVIEEMVGAMRDCGGAAFTAEDAEDWHLALRVISERMIGGPLP